MHMLVWTLWTVHKKQNKSIVANMAKTSLFPYLLNEAEWIELSAEGRLVWFTLIAMADKDGEVDAHITAVAHRARVPLDETENASAWMERPNPRSRFKEHQGRTLEKTVRGWKLLQFNNYWK